MIKFYTLLVTFVPDVYNIIPKGKFRKDLYRCRAGLTLAVLG